MRSSMMFAIACGATAAALAGEPASAANAWGGSFCIGYREGGADCSFTSLAQCQATASGIDAACYAAPPALLHEQGAYVSQPAPGQRQHPARVRRSE